MESAACVESSDDAVVPAAVYPFWVANVLLRLTENWFQIGKNDFGRRCRNIALGSRPGQTSGYTRQWRLAGSYECRTCSRY